MLIYVFQASAPQLGATNSLSASPNSKHHLSTWTTVAAVAQLVARRS